ncbi:hypothetical protein [Streptomyces sp. NPDC053720]|uniref:hypothetical protein n=1 Tax=Streptomyces sp. NPDC053720 TaxID=3154855 RepID=UPI00341BC053
MGATAPPAAPHPQVSSSPLHEALRPVFTKESNPKAGDAFPAAVGGRVRARDATVVVLRRPPEEA